MASSIKKIVFYFLLVVMFGRCISNSSNDTPSNISSNIPVDSVNQLINGESEGLWNELYPDKEMHISFGPCRYSINWK